MQKLLLKLMGLVIAAIVLGCAPPLRTAQPELWEDPLSFGLQGANDTEWRCPNGANVKMTSDIPPASGSDLYPTADFQVCVNRADSSKFKIWRGRKTTAMCVYPFRSDGFTLIETPQCFPAGGSPALLDLNDKSIQFMKIVNQDWTNQFNQSLGGSAPAPAHSKGPI